MKATRYILILAIFLITTSGLFTFTGCSDELAQTDILTPEQKALIGHAVIFDPYIAGMQTRAYNHDGFNHNDIMYIFRQGFNADGTYAQEEPWKAYQYTAQTDPSGNVLFSQWEIQRGSTCGFRGNAQENKDSIYWENGKSVRFRAYAKSSIENYNDYLYADYVSVSGPMGSVPMEFKHLGCRIGFQPFAGNTIVGVDYCTDPEDYKRKDNADSKENADVNDMLSDEEAEKVAKDVENAFNKLCMPGGVAMYSDADNNWWEWGTKTEVPKPTVQYGQLTAMAKGVTGEILAQNVITEGEGRNIERPNWNANLDGTRYCIVVPYEMSGTNAGSSITIPAKTRFKIYLKDVNTNNQENQYHIFSLQDIKDKEGNLKYPDGLTMRAGYSYVFVVGYKYDRLVVRVNEEGMDWKLTQPSASFEAEQETVTGSEPDYTWWKNAMNKAALEAMNDNEHDKFNPVFEISTIAQWKEFTDIVNGDIPDAGITYEKYIATEGTTKKHTVISIINKDEGFDFNKMTVSLKFDYDFQDQAIKSIGKEGHPFSGTFEGNGHTLSNFSGTVFGYVKNVEKDSVRITGLALKSTQNISLINKAEGAVIMGISVNGPSQHAITTQIDNSKINCVCHIGIGNNNGSLLGKGSGNSITSSYIAAAGKGTLTDDTSFGGNFVGCYFDKTLAPETSAIGIGYKVNYDDEITENYGARAVISPVLKAVKDNIPGVYTKEQPNVFYGHAPYKVMNENKGKGAEKYEYKVSTNYDDRYPVLNITKD